MKRNLMIMGLALAALSVCAQTSEVRLSVSLTGNGKGKGKWVQKIRGTQYQAELEVGAENLRPNSAYLVSISNGFSAWTMTDAFGKFNVARRYTARGTAVTAGNTVVVSNSAGATVPSGSFR